MTESQPSHYYVPPPQGGRELYSVRSCLHEFLKSRG